MEHASTGKAPAGKAAPPKKPADNKKGNNAKGGGLEEITDNRPRWIKYEHDCAELNGGEGLLVDEAVAKKFSTAFINLQVFETNRETLEETLIETVTLDLSSMLYPKDKVDVSYLETMLTLRNLYNCFIVQMELQ